jgi:UDP-N-acetylmuramoyl-tripeptide--D-alanyl-D-alanine ligase
MTEPIPWNLQDIIKATRGEHVIGEMSHFFSGISIDSRTISANNLFVAIKGEKFDGHHFIHNAIQRGASGVLMNKDNSFDLNNSHLQKKIVCAAVGDTTKALGDLASFNIKRSGVSVVAVTGSNGKTSTKEMVASVISQKFNTLSTIGNYNNEIGMPLSLFRLNASHQWAVLELGMNKPGEIRNLGEICSPDIGVITNIGPAHLEQFASIDEIMNAKGELLETIKPDGAVVLNADDLRGVRLSKTTSKRILFFGKSENADIRATHITQSDNGLSFKLHLPNENMDINLKSHGDFMVSNGLAAASVGFLVGIDAGHIKKGLEAFVPVKGRMNVIKAGKINIIDDTYNANPGSMEAAIITLKRLSKDTRSVLVAGDMLELGKHAVSMHEMIGSLAARSNISRLYATGNFAEKIAQGARNESMAKNHIFTGTKHDIIEDLNSWVQPGDWILVKGSRSTGMECIVKDMLALAKVVNKLP